MRLSQDKLETFLDLPCATGMESGVTYDNDWNCPLCHET